ncbi:hypothetical protein F4801DRAFT_412052 [Xylaria longipes]|nr:hypothetical protein F4801DRAFT_412052 [Xylaria longipes]
MVCCTNSEARDAAEATIRESGLLGGHKGFGLRGSALPLEHPTPARRLSSRGSSSSSHGDRSWRSEFNRSDISPRRSTSSTTANLSSSAVDNSSPFIINTIPSSTKYNPKSGPLCFATSIEPLIGRRVFASTNVDHAPQPYATAGVVIRVGEYYYQLTVGHLFEAKSKTFDEEKSQMSLDECHFDGQSDDDEQDSDYELERTGRGSATPEEALSSSSGSTNEETTHNYNTDVHLDSYLILDRRHGGGNVLAPERIQSPVGTNTETLTKPPKPCHRFPIGCLPRGKSFQAPMDYAIIAVSSDSVESMNRKINRTIQPHREVKGTAEVGHEECSIIVATHSCIIKGVLIPGKVTYRNDNAQFERLYQVQLESEVFEGDSGSPVIDRSTGNLYGHIVMGVAGTKVAYIIQAVDVFRDIEARIGKPVSIVTKENITKMTAPSSGSHIQSSLLSLRPSRSRDSSSLTSSYYSSGSSIFSGSSSDSTSTSTSTGAQDTNIASFTFPTPSLPCEFVGYGGCGRTFDLDDVTEPSWILPNDTVLANWEDKNSRGEYEYNNTLEEQRKNRKHRHKSGKSRN